MYYFDKDDLYQFNNGNKKNFAMPNGLGGFCSSSIINSTFRKQFGYLVAALNPPVERYLILNKTREKVIFNDKEFDLDTQKYDDRIAEGQKYLEEFSYNYVPTYLYNVSSIQIKKKIAPYYGFNTVAITYEIIAKKDCDIIIEPLFNYREQGDASEPEDLCFTESLKDNVFSLIPDKNPNVKIKMTWEGASLYFNDDKYTDGFYNDYDITNGDPRLDFQYKPVFLKTSLKANQVKDVSIIVTLDRITNTDAFSMIIEYEERVKKLIKQTKLNDSFVNNLAWSADSFIAYRKSTNLKTIMAGLPWFTDWGRDTMIAFTGLTLVTRRFKDAKEILKSFALYERNGLIPNMFPDQNVEPIYNTADASLWYLYAAYKYVLYSGDYDFIQKEIYQTMKNIIHAYCTKTENDIYMDIDYLIHAGSNLDQVTWMDVRVGDFVVTPRHGKPVEINALWYNGLKIMEKFAFRFEDKDYDFYHQLSQKVYDNFRTKFLNKKANALFDTVDPNDSKIRPNMLYAFSLPFKLFSKEETKPILDLITKDLYNTYGMRTLSPKDKGYKPYYVGPLQERDLAYHNGSTWAYLIGAYFDTFNYVYPNRKDELKLMFNEFDKHLNEGCVNGVAELFNGSYDLETKGCHNQAWSVGELLRSYYENILKEDN